MSRGGKSGKQAPRVGRPVYELLHSSSKADDEDHLPAVPRRWRWRWMCRIHEALAHAIMPSSEAQVHHVTVVIFLEFFAWGLVATILPEAFTEYFGAQQMWLVWGLMQGLKGFLSFLSAPILGALSDVFGRKPFLLLTVASTCLPLPFLFIHNLWYHVITFAITGAFAVTFSIVFAYVSDITTEADRSAAYGQVSATFAASLVISPAFGSLIQTFHGVNAVYALACAIAVIDVLYIWLYVPESMKITSATSPTRKSITWSSANPFGSLKIVFSSFILLKLSVIVFFSYLPEAGQYACIMLYLQNTILFTKAQLAGYIALLGILCIVAQTTILALLSRVMTQKHVVICALVAATLQLTLFGLVSSKGMIFAITVVVSLASMAYPALSALVSNTAHKEQQGVVQGMITGIRSLCSGLGPAIFGSLFQAMDSPLEAGATFEQSEIPGAPFLVGSLLSLVALVVAATLPDRITQIPSLLPTSSSAAFELSNFERDKEFMAKTKDIEDSDHEGDEGHKMVKFSESSIGQSMVSRESSGRLSDKS